jgi:hypothetical protein
METLEHQAQRLAAAINDSKKQLMESALHTRENLIRIQLQISEFKEEFRRFQGYSELQELYKRSQQLRRYKDGLEYITQIADMMRIKYKSVTRERILSLLQQQETLLAVEALSYFKTITLGQSESENVFGPIFIHVARTFDPSYDAIVESMEKDWLKRLEEIGWPDIQKDRVGPAFAQNVIRYCKLNPKSHYISHKENIHPLFYGMRKCYEVSFAFHFRGKKKTNQLNKVCFSEIARILYAICA